MRRVSVALSVLALAAPVLLVLGGSPAAAVGIAHYRFLPAQVFGAVAIGMPDPRTVSIQHFDPTTGQWDAPSPLVHTKGRVTCGAIDGRASDGGYAVLVECDAPYYEDQAPVHSLALASRDGRTWSRNRLPGEAYQEPAVSPSGTYAAWLVGQTGQFVEWSATTGFAKPARTTYRYDSGGETPVVDDTGTVTVIGPEPPDKGSDGCAIGIHTRDLTGALTHVQLTGTDPGCTEGSFHNLDALTVLGGGDERADQLTMARAAVGASWAVTKVAPAHAPGLVRYGYSRKRITTYFLYSSVPGSPIVAIGSPDRHRVLVQRFDEASQTWGPQTQVLATGRRCREAHLDLPSSPALYVAELRCGRAHAVLVSADATAWTVRDVGRRPWTVTEGGVALPARSGTTVVRTDGVREFPVTTDGPCDVVQAGRPGELVRLHGPRNGWPSKVQVSTGGAFRTVSKARRFAEPCRRLIVFPDGLDLEGRHHAREGRFVLRGDTWEFRYPKAIDRGPVGSRPGSRRVETGAPRPPRPPWGSGA